MKKVYKYLAIIITIALASVFFRWWTDEMAIISQQTVNAWTDEQQADCAIVLTGERHRLDEGFDLLYQGHVKKLIISGVNPSSYLEEIYPNIVFYGRIEPENIILEKNSKTTYGNAQQTLPLIEAMGCHDLILITSRMHMYRALRTFKANYPHNINIYSRATVGREFTLNQLAFESFKSMFYSLWAY